MKEKFRARAKYWHLVIISTVLPAPNHQPGGGGVVTEVGRHHQLHRQPLGGDHLASALCIILLLCTELSTCVSESEGVWCQAEAKLRSDTSSGRLFWSSARPAAVSHTPPPELTSVVISSFHILELTAEEGGTADANMTLACEHQNKLV